MIETYYSCKCVCHPALEQCGSCCEKFNKSVYQAVHRESLGECLEKLQTRIEKLEDLFAGRHFKPIHDALEIHIEKFNERITGLETVASTTSALNRKIPHKCPLCEGNKVRIYLNTDIENDNYKSSIQENLCHVCEGKGIIWG